MATSIWFLTAEGGDVRVSRARALAASSPLAESSRALSLAAHLSSLFLLSAQTSSAAAAARAQVIIEKHYTGTTGRSAVEIFWEEVNKRVKRDVRAAALRPAAQAAPRRGRGTARASQARSLARRR